MDKKQEIQQVLLELLEELPMEKISISTLIKRCGISRSLFYYYFDDLYDVIEQIIHSYLEQISKEALLLPNNQESLTFFVTKIVELSPYLQKLKGSKYFETAQLHIVTVLEPFLRDAMLALSDNRPLQSKDMDFLVDFMSTALVAYFTKHSSDRHFDSKEVSDYLYRIINAI